MAAPTPEESRRYYLKNRDRICARDKLRYENDPEYRAAKNAQSKAWAKKNKEARAKIARRTQLKLRYGITLEQYENLLNEQESSCAVCCAPATEFKGPLVVDHSHKTGMIRGLLCSRCNLLLGQAQDSIDLLASAIEYLRRHDV